MYKVGKKYILIYVGKGPLINHSLLREKSPVFSLTRLSKIDPVAGTASKIA